MRDSPTYAWLLPAGADRLYPLDRGAAPCDALHRPPDGFRGRAAGGTAHHDRSAQRIDAVCEPRNPRVRAAPPRPPSLIAQTSPGAVTDLARRSPIPTALDRAPADRSHDGSGSTGRIASRTEIRDGRTSGGYCDSLRAASRSQKPKQPFARPPPLMTAASCSGQTRVRLYANACECANDVCHGQWLRVIDNNSDAEVAELARDRPDGWVIPTAVTSITGPQSRERAVSPLRRAGRYESTKSEGGQGDTDAGKRGE
jgi:hypothetical protein